MSIVTRQLFKIRVSRFLRGTYRKVCEKFSPSDAGSPDNIFGEDIAPPSRNRSEKLKSTAVVFGTATTIIAGQYVSLGAKYSNPLSRKAVAMLSLGGAGVVAIVWYRYIDAAADGITEEDIDLMISMVEDTSFGSAFAKEDDYIKTLDVLHAITTGSYDPEANAKKADERLDKFSDDEDEDEDDEPDDKEKDPFDSGFESVEEGYRAPDRNKKKVEPTGIATREPGKFRQSFLPEADRSEESVKGDNPDAWLERGFSD